MPSIRVKSPLLSSPQESLGSSEIPSHLASIFAEPGGNSTSGMVTAEPSLQSEKAPPAMRSEYSRTLPAVRSRLGTGSGRIQAPCSRPPLLTADTQDSQGFLTVPRMSWARQPTRTSTLRSVVLSVIDQRGASGIFGDVPSQVNDPEHRDEVVDYLDVIDPQVATLSSLTNAANSLVFPPFELHSRKPTLILPPLPDQGGEDGRNSIYHHEDALDRHVEDVLARPSKLKRTLLGVWSFVTTPMGFITAIYGFLVVFWGAAIVMFVARIINLHDPNLQGFWVEISSQIVNGLFTMTGIGLIPYRALDTYRVSKIWHYKQKTKMLRAKAGLPQLYDENDLPDPSYDPNYVRVLTEDEERDLHRQQTKFQHHQTWYRPHGTETHRAFPINTALLICFLNDGNSFFQVLLCGVMWGMNRFERPAWTIGTLIPCSFLCGILSAIFIWRGGQKTKRVKEVQEKLKAALAAETPQNEGIVTQEPDNLGEMKSENTG